MNFFLNPLVVFIFIAYFSQEGIAKKKDAITGGLANNLVVNAPYVGKDSLTSSKNLGFPVEEPSPPMPVDEMPPLPPLEEPSPPMPVDDVQPLPSTKETPSFSVIDETPLPPASEIASPTPPTGAADNAPVLGGASIPETTRTESISQLYRDNQPRTPETAQPESQASLETKQVAQATAQDQYQARALQKAQQRQIAQGQLIEQHVNAGNSQNQGVQHQMSQEQFQKEAIQRSQQRQANQILDAQEAAEQQERDRVQQKQSQMNQQKVAERESPIGMAKADGKAEVGQGSTYQRANQVEEKPFKDVKLTNEISKNQTTSEHKEAQFSSAFVTDEHGNFIDESESRDGGAISVKPQAAATIASS